jgi:hypothetical protein
MIYRLWHLIVGHKWHERRTFCPPSDPTRSYIHDEDEKRARYGFTQFVATCPCGARREFRIVGRFDSAADELSELERMARL